MRGAGECCPRCPPQALCSVGGREYGEGQSVHGGGDACDDCLCQVTMETGVRERDWERGLGRGTGNGG